MSSTMLRVAEEAVQAEEEDIVMSVCYTMYRRMSLSGFRFRFINRIL